MSGPGGPESLLQDGESLRDQVRAGERPIWTLPMDSPANLEALARVTELLIDSEEERARERILVEAVEEHGWALAAALFRPDGPEPGGTWSEILGRGPQDLLVDAEQVAAMASGDLPHELPLGRQVLFAGEGAAATALALGGLDADEETLDLLEALFHLLVTVNGGLAGEAPALLDRLHAPLPFVEPCTQEKATERTDPPTEEPLEEQ